MANLKMRTGRPYSKNRQTYGQRPTVNMFSSGILILVGDGCLEALYYIAEPFNTPQYSQSPLPYRKGWNRELSSFPIKCSHGKLTYLSLRWYDMLNTFVVGKFVFTTFLFFRLQLENGDETETTTKIVNALS